MIHAGRSSIPEGIHDAENPGVLRKNMDCFHGLGKQIGEHIAIYRYRLVRNEQTESIIQKICIECNRFI